MISIFPKFSFSAAAGFSVSSPAEFFCPRPAVDVSACAGLTAKVSIRKEKTMQVRAFLKSFLKSFGLRPALRLCLIFIENLSVLNDGPCF
jgi:hypothetical protein